MLAKAWVEEAIRLRKAAADAEQMMMSHERLEFRTTPFENFGHPVTVAAAWVYEGPDRGPRCGLSQANLTREDALRLADWLYQMFGDREWIHLPDQAHWLDCAHWVSGRCSCRDERGEPK